MAHATVRNVAERAERFDVVVLSGQTRRKVLGLQFVRDGSIFVYFPKVPDSRGVASRLALPNESHGSVQLYEEGKVTSHLVKYSHHVDGEAHFSQDGKVVTEIRRRAAPLRRQRGHLFTLHVSPLSDLPAAREKRRVVQLPASLGPDSGLGVKVIASRWQDYRIAENPKFAPSREGRPLFLVSPPKGFALDDHVLALRVQQAASIATDDGPMLLFHGGFDVREIVNQIDRDSEFLTITYPCLNHDELRHRLGSIDLPVGG